MTTRPLALASPRRLSLAGRQPLAIGGAVAAAYVLSRLALLWRFPPFWDESQYATWVRDGFEDSHQRFVALANGKQPLLAWIGMGFMALGAEPLTAVRLVSASAGVVTIVMVALVAHRLGGLRVAVAGAVLAAVVPYLFVHNAVGIMDPLVAATATTALYLQVRLAERPRLDLALLLGLVLAAGLLTKETAKFAVALLPLSLVGFSWRSPALARRLGAWLGCAAIALVLAWVGYSILRLSDLYDDMDAAARAIGLHRSYGDALGHPGRWAEHNWPPFRDALGGYLTAPLVLASAVGAGIALREHVRYATVLLGWVLLPLGGAVLLAGTAYPRYILIVVPPIVVLAAFGLTRTAGWLATTIGGRRGAIAAVAVVALALLPSLVFDARVLAAPSTVRYPALDEAQFVTGWPAGQAWVDVAGELERRAAGRPTLVQLGDLYSPALSLYLRDRPEIELVTGTDPRGPAARFAIENGAPLERANGVVVLRPVWERHRPRGGTTLTLLERGVAWEGSFYPTPAALRAGLGVPDAQFDAFIAAHPEVQAWYAAWFGALEPGA